MHPKYQSAYYWEDLVRGRKLLATFNNEQITDESLFFQGIIYNSSGRRKLIEDVVHFRSLDALSGYLHYVFLPTAFLSFTNQEKGIIIPLGLTLEELIDYVSDNDFVRYHNYESSMRNLLAFSTELQAARGDAQQELVRRVEGLFNFAFQMDRDAYAMMHVYRSTTELGEYFSSLYQIDGSKQLGTELFYHKTGLRKADWQYLYEHAGDNIFASRKFMNCISNLLHTM